MEGNMNYSAPLPEKNGMATAALVMGICSLVFLCCGCGFLFAALAILFAALSRGAGRMSTNAKVGLGLSIGSLVLTVIISIVSLVSVVAALGSAFQNYDFTTEQGIEEFMEDYLDQYLGDSYNFDYDYGNDYDNGGSYYFDDGSNSTDSGSSAGNEL
ncbi:MAG: hypothetical protein PHC41_04100 [Lachnospiraceae bacterium]|jgi:hypothetical protein|nr:hypothetical protein [Lachnospiraceae bacterium]MDD3615390.1 hypothetical protein [Lachnospiraceae bacterium]